MRGLLEHLVADRNFARLAFFELPTAGPAALDQADATLDNFVSFLKPGTAPSAIGGPLAPAIMEAIPTGIWATIQHEIARGRSAALPELAPDITRFVLASFNDA
jgi:hypothetical protein